MKRILPVTRYEAECAYPSVADCGLSRRGFLRGAVAGALTLGGALLPDAAAVARGRRRWLRVVIKVHHRFQGCGRRFVEKVVVQTRSKRLHRFLRDARDEPTIRRALLAVLGRHGCRDIEDRKKLAALEGKLAQALVQVYRRRRRRSVATPVVTLVVARRMSMPNPGFMSAPPAPVSSL